jgi:hypothetical protein
VEGHFMAMRGRKTVLDHGIARKPASPHEFRPRVSYPRLSIRRPKTARKWLWRRGPHDHQQASEKGGRQFRVLRG